MTGSPTLAPSSPSRPPGGQAPPGGTPAHQPQPEVPAREHPLPRPQEVPSDPGAPEIPVEVPDSPGPTAR
jgi:hypothetical protein